MLRVNIHIVMSSHAITKYVFDKFEYFWPKWPNMTKIFTFRRFGLSPRKLEERIVETCFYEVSTFFKCKQTAGCNVNKHTNMKIHNNSKIILV